MRRLVAQTSLEPRHLVLPMFVADGIDEPRPISAMPGVVQHTRASLRAAAADAVAAGVGGLMIFGVPREDDKDAAGSIGLRPDGILNRALADLAADLGDATVVMADTCLDEFTDHGHCGIVDESGRVDNDATNAQYVKLAVAQANAGAHVVGPSGMMDGQVAAIRAGLDAAGYADVAILAYAAKFASAFGSGSNSALGLRAFAATLLALALLALPAMARRPKPEEMFTIFLGTPHERVAVKNAADSCMGASRLMANVLCKSSAF
jgi:porphobilinogen synthase